MSGIAVVLFLGTALPAMAGDPCCFGRTEKHVTGVRVVTNVQEGRICMEEVPDGKPKGCRGLSGCFEVKDHGGVKKGDRVIVTGWRAGDRKCYQGPNCGKGSVPSGDKPNSSRPHLKDRSAASSLRVALQW